MLFILDPPTGAPAALSQARDILRREIDHPSKTVFVARNDGPGISELVQHANMASDRPWRVVLWVKNSAVFPDGKENQLFGADKENVGVLLDFSDQVVRRFKAGATIIDVEKAFRQAERGV
jgi:hypothetical protein